MRVVQNKQPHPEKVAAEPAAKPESGDEAEQDAPTDVEKKSKEKLVVSGVATKVSLCSDFLTQPDPLFAMAGKCGLSTGSDKSVPREADSDQTADQSHSDQSRAARAAAT